MAASFISSQTCNVACWHIASLSAARRNVRSWVLTGTGRLTAKVTHLKPQRNFRLTPLILESCFGLRTFTPPFGPPDLVRSPSGLHDNPLIGGTKWLGKTGQRGLDEPRFEDHSCSLAIGIEFPGHSQRLQCRCDAPGRHTHQHDGADPRLACALPFPGLLDHSQGFTGCGAVAFKPAFCELK